MTTATQDKKDEAVETVETPNDLEVVDEPLDLGESGPSSRPSRGPSMTRDERERTLEMLRRCGQHASPSSSATHELSEEERRQVFSDEEIIADSSWRTYVQPDAIYDYTPLPASGSYAERMEDP